MTVEGHEAFAAGARVKGRVASVEPVEQQVAGMSSQSWG
jgi:hypothetical protein